MRSRVLEFLILAALSALAPSCARPATCTLGGEGDLHAQAGQLFVIFEKSVATQDAATRIIEMASFRVVSFLTNVPRFLAIVDVPVGRECESIEQLEAVPGVESATVNIVGTSK